MIGKLLLSLFCILFFIGFGLVAVMSIVWMFKHTGPFQIVNAIMVLIIGFLGFRDGAVFVKNVYLYITKHRKQV